MKLDKPMVKHNTVKKSENGSIVLNNTMTKFKTNSSTRHEEQSTYGGQSSVAGSSTMKRY